MTSAWLGGGSSTLDGTSMASPHMAGAAALYLGANPEAWPATVNSAILPNASQYKLYNLGAGSPNLLLFTGSGGGGTQSQPGVRVHQRPPIESTPERGRGRPTPAAATARTATSGSTRSDASTWSNVGTNSATYTHAVGTRAGSFYLRVIVPSNGTSYTTLAFFVYKEPEYSECGSRTICP